MAFGDPWATEYAADPETKVTLDPMTQKIADLSYQLGSYQSTQHHNNLTINELKITNEKLESQCDRFKSDRNYYAQAHDAALVELSVIKGKYEKLLAKQTVKTQKSKVVKKVGK